MSKTTNPSPAMQAFPDESPDDTVQRFGKGFEEVHNKHFASIWDAIENTPAEAENMKLRAQLMMALKKHISRLEMSQDDAAKLLNVTLPRVSELACGKIDLFALDALVNMAAAAGLHVEMRIMVTA
jgi:predicted XRE-type DNA-binding protein